MNRFRHPWGLSSAPKSNRIEMALLCVAKLVCTCDWARASSVLRQIGTSQNFTSLETLPEILNLVLKVSGDRDKF